MRRMQAAFLWGAGVCAWMVLCYRVNAVSQTAVIIDESVAATAAVDSGAGYMRDAENGIAVDTADGGSVPAKASGRIRTEAGGCINVNTATAAALTALPGIGPVLAERIIEYRVANGRFSCAEDLMKVKGIGPAKYTKIKSRCCF